MPETTPLIKAALNLTAGAGFDVYEEKRNELETKYKEHYTRFSHELFYWRTTSGKDK